MLDLYFLYDFIKAFFPLALISMVESFIHEVVCFCRSGCGLRAPLIPNWIMISEPHCPYSNLSTIPEYYQTLLRIWTRFRRAWFPFLELAVMWSIWNLLSGRRCFVNSASASASFSRRRAWPLCHMKATRITHHRILSHRRSLDARATNHKDVH